MTLRAGEGCEIHARLHVSAAQSAHCWVSPPRSTAWGEDTGGSAGWCGAPCGSRAEVMRSIPGIIGRRDADPLRRVTWFCEKDAPACVSRDKLRERPRSVAGGAPGMGHSVYAFAVLQILYREFMSLLTQAHRSGESLPCVPRGPGRAGSYGAMVTDAAMETSGAGGNRLGGMRDQGQTLHTGWALLAWVMGRLSCSVRKAMLLPSSGGQPSGLHGHRADLPLAEAGGRGGTEGC